MKCKLVNKWSLSLYVLIIIVSIPKLTFAQNLRKITGTVVEGLKPVPVSGVTVSVKNINKQTITDKNGQYAIEARSQDTLIFRYVGSVTKEILIGNRSIINITLSQDISNLSEVVVIGYGSVKKSDLTGAVAQVNISDMIKAPVASFSEALAGRVAGVRVSSADGQPGIDMDIVIRGANSLTQNNSPLYVIDGFPIEDLKSASINPTDIESISILKDASATAVYGSRAANGVVVIETKKGKIGSPVISMNSSLGFGQLRKQMEVMSPYEFLRYQTELAANTGLNKGLAGAYFTDGKTIDSYKDSVGINWQDQIFRKSPTFIVDLAVRGGSEQTKFSISGSIFNQEGVIINSGFNRYQARVAVDQLITKRIKGGINVNYGNTMAKGQQVAAGDSKLTTSSYLFYTTWNYRPISGSDDLDLTQEEFDPLYINDRLNPRISSLNDYTRNGTSSLLSNAYVNYSITDNLVLKLTGSSSKRRNTRNLFYNSHTASGRPHPLNVRGVNGSTYGEDYDTWSNENTLTYNKTFKKSHQLNVMGGFSLQSTTFNANGFAAENIPNESLGIQGLDEGSAYLLTSSGSGNRLMSFFSRVNYSYKSKYLFTATMRGDASSKFAQGKRWGYFPSAAVAWNMINEAFMKDFSSVINQSKLRASYGITGNNRVGDFSYLPQLSFPIASSYSYNNGTPTKGTIASSLANADLKWESTAQLDIGYDLGLFKNRIELVADWYTKTTSDLLLNADIPYSTGFAKAFKNIGTIRNRGLEFTLNTVNIKTESFKWLSSFNISFNKNKILKLTTGLGNENMLTVVPFESQHNMPLYIAQVGESAGMFYGLVFNGVYQYSDFDNPTPGVYTLKADVPNNGNARTAIKPGDIKYKDLNADGLINSLDRTVIGNGNPIHIGGFSNNFSYKGFELNVFFQWSYGNQMYNANRLLLEGNDTQREYMNQFASYINRWTPENQTNENFRAGGQGPPTHSSRVIEDGSYLRLKTLSLTYNIPQNYIRKAHIKQLSVNVSAQNLFTWTKYSGLDPEISVRNSVLTPGFDFSAYPQAKTTVFGISATF
jgi:TonB-linked SusC/RagA family outer membrane protein